MEPTGTKKPVVYMLGEGPGKAEDRKGIQFIGESGQTLRMRIPDDWLPALRWNNCVRTRPPGNRDPSAIEVECCRPSIVADIEATQPVAIFGFGNVPLDWALKESGITKWAGRRVPVKIGKHTCWFFPMMHPSFINRGRKFTPRNASAYGSDMEFAFATHLRNAFDLVEDLDDPRVYTKEEVMADVSFVTGENGWKDVDRVLDYLDLCYDEPYVGFDYETSCLRPYTKGAKILTVGLARKHDAFAFPIHKTGHKWTPEQLKAVQKGFRDFLHKAKCRKVAHQAGFEMEWSAFNYGRECVLEGEWEDTMSEAFILDERPWCNSLDFLFLQWFGLRIKEFSDVNRKAMDKEEITKVLRYNAIDAKCHLMLHFAQIKELRRIGLEWVYEHQMKRVRAGSLTTLKGVPIDQKVAGKFFDDYTHDLKTIENEVRATPEVKRFAKVFGHEFQPSNNDDVLNLLRRLVGLRTLSATNEKELAAFSGKTKLIPLIQEWRSIAKTISTYIVPVIPPSEHLYPDGMLHPHLATSKVRTNRTSSEDPNIQNWPMHTEDKVVRKQVSARKAGRIIVKVDYSGMQARNVAMESRDKRLVQAYWNGYDIHSDWRARIVRRVPTWISRSDLKNTDRMKHFRQETKNKFVFPTFFGSQAKSLARDLGIAENSAQDLLEEFYDEFPDLPKWHAEVYKHYDKFGFVTGLSGFRRHAPIERNQMINSPIQGDEALIVCNAMDRLSQTGDERLQANLMVHDDLTFVWERSDLDKLVPIVVKEMLVKEFDWINVPLGVEVSFGDDWFKQTKYGEYESTADGGIKEVKK